MQCSNPAAAKAAIGGMAVTTLSIFVRALKHIQTARQTSALHMIPRVSAGMNASDVFALAVLSAARPTEPASKGILRGVEHQRRGYDRADKIAGERKDPIEQKRARRHLAARPGHDNDVVSGEQFRPSNDDHDEAGRKDQPDEKPPDAVRQLSSLRR